MRGEAPTFHTPCQNLREASKMLAKALIRDLEKNFSFLSAIIFVVRVLTFKKVKEIPVC